MTYESFKGITRCSTLAGVGAGVAVTQSQADFRGAGLMAVVDERASPVSL